MRADLNDKANTLKSWGTGYWATSSTRRFFARPSSLLLEATGAVGPLPKGVSRAAGHSTVRDIQNFLRLAIAQF